VEYSVCLVPGKFGLFVVTVKYEVCFVPVVWPLSQVIHKLFGGRSGIQILLVKGKHTNFFRYQHYALFLFISCIGYIVLLRTDSVNDPRKTVII